MNLIHRHCGGILIREYDNYTCDYCGTQLDRETLKVDPSLCVATAKQQTPQQIPPKKMDVDWVTPSELPDLTGGCVYIGEPECECGKDKHGFTFHMQYCPKFGLE